MRLATQAIEHEPDSAAPRRWAVLIVDDEPEVRQVTHLVLSSLEFAGRGLELIDAASAEQAATILRARDDIAVMLLDVVMETPHAGLDLVHRVRHDIGNHFVRIVLRTGQPGEAPEQDVVARYDINDYREKTELTASRLSATMFTALRSYRDIRTIDSQRRGLERVIRASTDVLERHSANDFLHAVLHEVAALAGEDLDLACCNAGDESGRLVVTAGCGRFQALLGRDLTTELGSAARDAVATALDERRSVFADGAGVLWLGGRPHSPATLVIASGRALDANHQQLLALFAANAAVAWDNLHLGDELIASQQEMVFLLAGTAETRSHETASHVRRVGMLVDMLAHRLGLDDGQCELLRLASPLHDIGKVGIPDTILNKPGPHTPDEEKIMRTHTEIGAQLLAGSRRPVMRAAAEIALTHHENWDGSGYPRGLSGDAIPLSGRITMVADVFDALGSQRCYKPSWPAADIREFMQAERRRKFDPAILDLLFSHWDEALALRERYPD